MAIYCFKITKKNKNLERDDFKKKILQVIEHTFITERPESIEILSIDPNETCFILNLNTEPGRQRVAERYINETEDLRDDMFIERIK
ncbi:MAG: hypothetical protein QF475_03485 [Candidatus Undinarchaeales archaeon]|jgi:hypothetical protein|nr:hypothetical protein [Candidatus Undinarchaeales archaeon]